MVLVNSVRLYQDNNYSRIPASAHFEVVAALAVLAGKGGWLLADRARLPLWRKLLLSLFLALALFAVSVWAVPFY